MSSNFAVLLDGGFLRHKLSTRHASLDAEGICSFASQVLAMPCVTGMNLHRIYFYDARPLEEVARTPLGGDEIDFGSSRVAARNRRVQNTLIRSPFFALRFGELLHEGWRLRKRVLEQPGPRVEIGPGDLEPSIRQKGVDMRIGLDIASLTLKRHAQVIVLVTGDSDFVPAMKFARREGAQLFLITLGHGIRDSMREHADLVIDEFPLPAGANDLSEASRPPVQAIYLNQQLRAAHVGVKHDVLRL